MPDVFYIDDDPSAFLSVATKEQKARILAVTYDDDPAVNQFDAASGMLVWIFDFFLVDSASRSRDENGLSLFQKWKAAASGRPTSVVVSNDVEKAIGEPLGPIERRHVVSQSQGVEWIGDKSAETLQQVGMLADAASLIASTLKTTTVKDSPVGSYDLEALSLEILGVKRDSAWETSAQRQIDRARPPREVPSPSSAATARAIIVWLTTHVLPYPSFLLSDAQAALRLKVTPTNFQAIAELVLAGAQSKESAALQAALYGGPLDKLLGRRWWRAAIDDLAWQLSQHKEGFDAGLKVLAGKVGIELLSQAEPVLLSSADLVETAEVAEARDCVRVTDENFPANVDPAWVLIKSARDDRELAAKVIFEDRELLAE